jgi:hypothetical protein
VKLRARIFSGGDGRRSIGVVRTARSAGQAYPRNGLTPIRQIHLGPNGEWSDSWAAAGNEVSVGERVLAALRMAQTAAWFLVKVIYLAIAVPLILIFAIASFAAMFAHSGW